MSQRAPPASWPPPGTADWRAGPVNADREKVTRSGEPRAATTTCLPPPSVALPPGADGGSPPPRRFAGSGGGACKPRRYPRLVLDEGRSRLSSWQLAQFIVILLGPHQTNENTWSELMAQRRKKPWWNQGLTRDHQRVDGVKETSVLGLRSISVDTSTQAAAETEGRACSKHRKRSWYGVVHTHIDGLSRAVEGPSAE
jgi:hypothetical protein